MPVVEIPKRIQLRRTKGWRKPEGAIVVSRPHSRWANPFIVGEGYVGASGYMHGHCAGEYNAKDQRSYDLPLRTGLTAAEAVQLYRFDLEEALNDPDPGFNEIRQALRGLAGHDLCCWCALVDTNGDRFPCHADVLLELANAPD